MVSWQSPCHQPDLWAFSKSLVYVPGDTLLHIFEHARIFFSAAESSLNINELIFRNAERRGCLMLRKKQRVAALRRRRQAMIEDLDRMAFFRGLLDATTVDFAIVSLMHNLYATIRISRPCHSLMRTTTEESNITSKPYSVGNIRCQHAMFKRG